MVEHEAPIVSHGRGGLSYFCSDHTLPANTTDTASQPGQGNIGPDSNEYMKPTIKTRQILNGSNIGTSTVASSAKDPSVTKATALIPLVYVLPISPYPRYSLSLSLSPPLARSVIVDFSTTIHNITKNIFASSEAAQATSALRM